MPLFNWKHYSVDRTKSLIVPKSSAEGIYVDTEDPTFGWRDIVGILKTRAGATNPTDAVYVGGLRQLQCAVNDELTINYHIPHDYKAGTDIFIHPHWSHNATTVTGGSVTWGLEFTYSKGHNQAAFSAPVSSSLVSNASTTQYQHILTDLQISAASPNANQIDTDLLEPDGILLVRFYLSANNITVSGGGVPAPFIHCVDVHYQSTSVATKQRAPDFYT